MSIAAVHNSGHSRFSLMGVLSSIGNFLVMVGEANPRLRKMERLMAMSDEQLAERGLTRDQIARHVFADVYYI